MHSCLHVRVRARVLYGILFGQNISVHYDCSAMTDNNLFTRYDTNTRLLIMRFQTRA